MFKEIWHGHELLFSDPIRARWLPTEKGEIVLYLVEDTPELNDEGDEVRQIFDLPKDQAINLAEFILRTAGEE